MHVTQCVWREEWEGLGFEEQANLQSWQGVGFPMHEEAAVMNTDSGELVPRDGETQGEIVLRGNAVMKGYYKDPDATRAALHDGWFFSGDAAVWQIMATSRQGQLKDVIISGGENIRRLKLRDISIGTQPLRRLQLSPSLMINGERYPAPLLS